MCELYGWQLFSYWIAVIFLIPVLIGSLVTYWISEVIEWKTKKDEKRLRWCEDPTYKIAEEKIIWQPVFLGLLERIIFCVYIGSYSLIEVSNSNKVDLPQGILVGAFSWTALKLVLGWRRFEGPETWKRVLGFSALMNGVVSILIGVFGGFIIKANKGCDFIRCMWGRSEGGAIIFLILFVIASSYVVYMVCLWEDETCEKK